MSKRDDAIAALEALFCFSESMTYGIKSNIGSVLCQITGASETRFYCRLFDARSSACVNSEFNRLNHLVDSGALSRTRAARTALLKLPTTSRDILFLCFNERPRLFSAKLRARAQYNKSSVNFDLAPVVCLLSDRVPSSVEKLYAGDKRNFNKQLERARVAVDQAVDEFVAAFGGGE